jgi:hypothetical protein
VAAQLIEKDVGELEPVFAVEVEITVCLAEQQQI